MIERRNYLDKLLKWKDKDVIKVITGMRRCGKSTLLKQFQQILIDQGVNSKNIVFINFEELENIDLLDYKSLYSYIKKECKNNKRYYIFLDEIQNVKNFEKAIDSLYVKGNFDIYITGSNSYLLSGELATLLSGRYIEISILPFSFKEYTKAVKNPKPEESFASYVKYGGMPYSSILTDISYLDDYLEGIYNTVIVKDIEERRKRKLDDGRNERYVNDTFLLKKISQYLASSIGNIISITGITDYIVSSGRKISNSTVDSYIDALTEAFIFYKADRYDLNGKTILKQNSKYYIVDTGLRKHLVRKKESDIGYLLENIVYFELLRRDYKVYVGKSGTNEIDFVAIKNDSIEYYQVSASLLDESTFSREIKPLKIIKDNYKKTILTLDKFTLGNYEGIEVVNVLDWLLQ